MEKGNHTTEHLQEGIVFSKKDVFFEAVKSTAMGFAATTGIVYGLIKLLDGAITKNWTLKPKGYDIAISSAVGGFVGAFSGAKQKIITEIKNDKADFLNKYKNQPKLQNELILGTGGNNFDYQKTHAEQTLRTVNEVSFWSWIIADIADINRRNRFGTISGALAASTILSGIGEMGAKLFGMGSQADKERENMNHLEKALASKAQAQEIKR